MKNSQILFTILASSLLTGALFSQEAGSSYTSAMDSRITIGGNYSRINFTPDGEPSFNGNLGGVHGMYEYRPENAFYAGVKLYWRQGSMEGGAGTRSLADIDTAERVGYTWACNDALFSLYTGFGFRYLAHHLHASSSGGAPFNGSFFPPFLSSSTSLKFDYNEFYVPLGFVSEYTVSSWFTLGLNFEWMPQIFSTAKIRPLGGAYWSLESTFANFCVEVPFNFNLTRCGNWMLTLSPFYNRWQDGHSTAKTSSGTPLGLPQNTYNFYGVDLNVTYAF